MYIWKLFQPLTFPALVVFTVAAGTEKEADLPPLPGGAELVFEVEWSSGKIDPTRWYVPRKKWGQGNHGVVPENVCISSDTVAGKEKHVLVCQADGDLYDGPVIGYEGHRTRVGEIVVTSGFSASGRYEVVMKIGSTREVTGGPKVPMRLKGAVPAVWTAIVMCRYRMTKRPARMARFARETARSGDGGHRADVRRNSCGTIAGPAVSRVFSNTWGANPPGTERRSNSSIRTAATGRSGTGRCAPGNSPRRSTATARAKLPWPRASVQSGRRSRSCRPGDGVL